jgi:hypothetical protein
MNFFCVLIIYFCKRFMKVLFIYFQYSTEKCTEEEGDILHYYKETCDCVPELIIDLVCDSVPEPNIDLNK